MSDHVAAQLPHHLRRRWALARLWPRIALILALVPLLMVVYSFWRAPWLVNPVLVAGGLRDGSLAPELIGIMAVLLPFAIWIIVLLVLLGLLVVGAGYRREKGYLRMMAEKARTP